jgi:hypothetical protein
MKTRPVIDVAQLVWNRGHFVENCLNGKQKNIELKEKSACHSLN